MSNTRGAAVAGALLVVAASITPATAQVRIGATELALGQSRGEVLAALTNHHRVDSTRVGWVVFATDGSRPTVRGSLEFTKGRLTAIARNWTPSRPDDGVAVARAAIQALTAMARSSDSSCRVLTADPPAPGRTVSQIRVDCGDRIVSVAIHDQEGGRSVEIWDSWHTPEPTNR